MAIYNGTDGADEFIGDDSADTMNGFGGDDWLEGWGGADTINGGEGNDVIFADAGNDNVDGGAGDDSIFDDAGDDILTGGAGVDVLFYYYATAGVTVNLSLTTQQNTGGAGRDTITGFEGLSGSTFNDTLTGDANANLLEGDLGADHLSGGGGDDLFWIIDGSHIVAGERYSGGSGWDALLLEMGGDLTLATIDADIEEIFAAAGVYLTAAQLAQFQFITVDGGISITTGGAVDLRGRDVYAEAFYLQAGGITLDLRGFLVGFTVYGSGGDDVIYGGEGADHIETHMGADTVEGGGGADYIYSGGAALTADGGEGDDEIYGAGGDDYLVGGLGADIIFASVGDDEVYGGAGADQISLVSTGLFMADAGDDNDYIDLALNAGPGEAGIALGGAGDDTFALWGHYLFEGAAIQLDGGAGIDLLVVNVQPQVDLSSLTFTGIEKIASDAYTVVGLTPEQLDLFEDVDVWTLNITAAGTADISGALNLPRHLNLLVGGAVINMAGGGAAAVEVNGSSGVDTVTGGAFGDLMWGHGGDDTLHGDGGDDRLDGGGGADRMYGGVGDDIYVIDDAGDVAIERAGEGIDSVYSTISLTLGKNLDTLFLTGSSAIDGTGHAGANNLYGNSADNTLSGGGGHDRLKGGAGADTMIGGTGNDVFVVDDEGDVVVEYAGEGIDTVNSSVSFTLGADVEKLALSGAASTGIGNALNNRLAGNAADNLLEGHGGADLIEGEGGADTLLGGAGNDKVYGGAGDDTITGGTGGDRMSGGAGADTFIYQGLADSTVAASDRIVDFDPLSDVIDFSAIDADANLGGDQAFTLTTSFTGAGGEMVLGYAASSNTTITLDVDGDRIADFRLRIQGEVTGDAGFIL